MPYLQLLKNQLKKNGLDLNARQPAGSFAGQVIISPRPLTRAKVAAVSKTAEIQKFHNAPTKRRKKAKCAMNFKDKCSSLIFHIDLFKRVVLVSIKH